MNKVECSVSSCQHYKEDFCVLDKIQVDGPAAKEKTQTCCLSFDEKKETMSNSTIQPMQASIDTKIQCKAKNCTFNNSAQCEANCISINNANNSVSTKSGTLCGSFRER